MGITVLSLFDGISCGQIALERAGIDVNLYLASEVDKHAIKVTQNNYPNTVQLGDVTKIDGRLLPKVDLLIGGSPCQGFSFAGKQLNFSDSRSKLFLEYYRLYKRCTPDFFLFENVPMRKEFRTVITSMLGVDPVQIDSAMLSLQHRKRLYWTNIKIGRIEDAGLTYGRFLYRLGHGFISDEIKMFEKYPTLAAQSPATKYRIIEDMGKAVVSTWAAIRTDSSISRAATPEECELFQTIPVGYTSAVKKTHRYRCIGDGWTVDVISHILKGLPDEWKKEVG